MNLQVFIAVAAVVAPLFLVLAGLVYKVGSIHAQHEQRITRNENDIGTVFKKLDDIHAYVKNGRG